MKRMNFPNRREQRRREAEQRNKVYAGKSVKQRLVDLDRRPGTCAKQRARLLEALAR